MPDVKISALPAATTVSDVDVLVINQGSPATTKKVTYGTIVPTVNANVGTFGSDSAVAQVTVDSKGRVTAAASVPVNASNISTGTLPVNRGGTGATTLAVGGYLKGNDASAITSQNGIPAADITGQCGVVQGGTGRSSFPTAGFVKSPGGAAQLTSSAAVNLASEVTGTLSVERGGTGQTILNLNGYLKGAGTSAITSQTGVPVADITGTLGFDKGGTGQTTRQAAMDALAGATTSGHYLRGDGADVVMSALQASDLTGTLFTAGAGLNGGSVSTGGTISANFGTTAGTITQGGTAVLKAGDQMTGKLGIGTAPTAAALTVDTSGISFSGYTQAQTRPFSATTISSAIGSLSITSGGYQSLTVNASAGSLTLNRPVIVSIENASTGLNPSGLVISAYVRSTSQITVTIFNPTPSTITLGSTSSVYCTVINLT